MPGPVRSARTEQAVDGVAETWTNGFLLDMILTRDAWMHRSDICAGDRDAHMVLTADHDGVLVDDVVAEWAGPARPARTTSSSPGRRAGAGTRVTGGESHELDAVGFCRVVSGRGTGTGLLAVQVPF